MGRGAVSRLRHGALVAIFFGGATALYTYPFVLDLPRALLKSGGDYLGEAALVGWNAHRLIRDPLGLFDAQFVFHTQFFYPHSNTQAYFQTLFFPGLLAVPGLLLTDNALLVTNVLMFLGITLSGALTYALAFALTGRVVPSLLAGVVFAYLPYRIDHLGQFTVQMGFLLPVIFWAFYRFLLWRRWGDLALVVFGIWAQALSTLYYAYGVGLLLVPFLLAFVLLRPGTLSWSLVGRAAVGVLLLVAVLAPFLKPYVDVHRALGFQREMGTAQVASMDLFSLFDPGVFNRVYHRVLRRMGGVEGGLFPGFLVLALVVLAVARARWQPETGRLPPWTIPARRALVLVAVACLLLVVVVPRVGGVTLDIGPVQLLRIRHLTLAVTLLPFLALGWLVLEGRRRLTGPLTAREWVVTLLFLAVLTYLSMTGPTLKVGRVPAGSGFYRWLYLYVPGASAFGAPGRWALVFVLPLALLAAFGARAVTERLARRWRPALAIALLLGVMIEYVAFPIPWGRAPDPPPVYRWLAEQPGDFAILELPVQDGGAEAWFMYWATVHWKRLVNGQLSFFGPTLQEVADLTGPLDLDPLIRRLRQIFPLRYLVVHRARMRNDAGLLAQRLHWEELRAEGIPELPLARSFDGDDVYAVPGTPEVGIALRREFSADVVRRRPVAEYVLRFTGEDAEVRRWVDLDFNGRPVQRVEHAGPGTVRLPAPYNPGDRNELRFVHHYAISPAVTRQARYRIGRTSVHSPVDIQAASGGKYSGNVASIRVNGVERVSLPRRGYHVVALDPGDGRVVAAGQFDTFQRAAESRRMAALIEELPPGTIVVAAAKHDGAGQLTEEAVRALRSVGGREDTRGTLWLSHLVIGVRGAVPGEAWEAAGARELVASIGRERPLALVLDAFALR